MSGSIGQHSNSGFDPSKDLSQSFAEVKKGFETIAANEQDAASIFSSAHESFATSQNADKQAIEETLKSQQSDTVQTQESPLEASFEERPLTQEELQQQALFRQVCEGNGMLQELHFQETHPEVEGFLSAPPKATEPKN